jgi:hypothetical protein
MFRLMCESLDKFTVACIMFLQQPTLSRYVHHSSREQCLDTGYIVIGYIKPENGEPLSKSWENDLHDSENLFRGLARIYLSLARAPMPRVGSLQFQDDGTLTLTNRPLSCCIIILENNGAERVIGKDETYETLPLAT